MSIFTRIALAAMVLLAAGGIMAGSTGLSTKQALTATSTGLLGTSASEGSSLYFSRADHIHDSHVTSTGSTTGRTLQDRFADTVNVRDYGAKGDGTTDDYAAIQRAVAKINALGGGTLVFPKGVYWVGQHKISGGGSANSVTNFNFTTSTGLVIDGQGSVINMDGSFTRTADYTIVPYGTYSYQDTVGFSFTDVRNLTIRDLEINGNSQNTVHVAAMEGGSTGIYLIHVLGATLSNVYVHHYPTDGMQISNNAGGFISRNVTVVGSRFDYNGRLGAAITGLRGGTFTGTSFSYTGHTAYGSHAPLGGVDIEPNDPSYAMDGGSGDIAFNGCAFIDNGGYSAGSLGGISFAASNVSSTPWAITVRDTTFSNSNPASKTIVQGTAPNLLFDRCEFRDVVVEPGFALPGMNSRTEITHSKFISTSTTRAILEETTGVGVARAIVHDSSFWFLASGSRYTGAFITYPIWLQGPAHEFYNNKIFISGGQYSGGGGADDFAIFNGSPHVANNIWDTDLATAGAFYRINYVGAQARDEVYASPAHFGPHTVVQPWSVSYGGVTSTSYTSAQIPFDTLKSTSPYTYKPAIMYNPTGVTPTTVAGHAPGDILLNAQASPNGLNGPPVVGWECMGYDWSGNCGSFSPIWLEHMYQFDQGSSSNFTPDVNLYNYLTLRFTDTWTVRVNNPINARGGARLLVHIRNTGPATLTSLTWDTQFVFASSTPPTGPVPGKSNMIQFAYYSPYWIETSRATALATP
jgi:hypothetical protein